MDAGPRQPRDRVRRRHARRATPGNAPGGIAAQGAAGNYWNGPYGYGHYLSRFLLPDNGLINWDGNRLRGNFYAFQVGTVKFISLDADDVIYQDGAVRLPQLGPERRPGDHLVRRADPERHGHLQPRLHRRPRARREEQLAGARLLERPARTCRRSGWRGRWRRPAAIPSVDMIVVFMHQCAMSTSVHGNGSDLGIRQAWLPLFDKYEVDLVLSGHEHDYERSYPVRGYDAGEFGTVVVAQPGPDPGRDGRHPPPVGGDHRAVRVQRHPGLEHRRGHGVPGARRRRHQRADQHLRHRHGRRQAAGEGHHRAERRSPARRRPGSPRTRPTRSRTRPGRRRSTRPTPTATRSSTWTRASGRGETTITFQYFAIPAVSNEAGTAHDGTTTLPSTPTETFVFGRKVGRR